MPIGSDIRYTTAVVYRLTGPVHPSVGPSLLLSSPSVLLSFCHSLRESIRSACSSSFIISVPKVNFPKVDSISRPQFIRDFPQWEQKTDTTSHRDAHPKIPFRTFVHRLWDAFYGHIILMPPLYLHKLKQYL